MKNERFGDRIGRRLGVGLIRALSTTKEEMARYAMKNTRVYRRLYEPFRKHTFAFADLPILTKAIVGQSHPFDMLSQKLASRVFKYGETTGSTGSPTPSFFTTKEFKGSLVLSRITPFSPIIRRALADNRRAVCGLACGFTIAGASFQQILDNYGFLTINVDARTTIAPPERVARLLARFQPSVVVAAETDFLAWMRVLREDYPRNYDRVVGSLKVLLSTAELCSEARSRQISKEFDIIHVDNYACVEGFFSLACPCGEKHVLPAYHTEVLSDDLSRSAEFGTGRFAFTNLIRRSTPFVRYLLDDLVTIHPSGCPYGFKKSVIPHGRYELTVVLKERRYGTRDFEDELFRDHLFGEYQVEVQSDGLEVTAEAYDESLHVVPEEIGTRLEQRFGVPAVVRIVPYGELRDYRRIRTSKPLLRLTDRRACATQEVPRYL
jgi:phenylacetate-CoA ligase